jgi:hypothetical protein
LMLTRAYILYSYTQYLNTKFLYIFYTKTRGNGSEFFTTHIKKWQNTSVKTVQKHKESKSKYFRNNAKM